jgi:predicted short-subunit dehydrogenase-like oxidoreductase (DUF2520 family)
MITVNILGTGNVAWHLLRFVENHPFLHLQGWYGRKMAFKINHKNIFCDDISYLNEASVTIIAVSDDAIAELSSQLCIENQLVVHTSGSKSMDVLDSKNRKGVFYPLQSFSKNKPVDFSTIPIAIETECEKDVLFLKEFSKLFSTNVIEINSKQRLSLHISAVFANNFVNLMYQKAYQLCQENNMEFEILIPLIQETATKIKTINPVEAQTGPAKRKDLKTIALHQDFLKESNFLEVYNFLTKELL